MTPFYTPTNWYWLVGGDDSRFWSSAAAGWVSSVPSGAGVTPIASEEELWEVLRQQAPLGLPSALRPVPTITPRQLRLTLLEIGITEPDVDAALADNPAGMIEWKFATEFRRDHPLIDAIGAVFSLPPEQIDSLWAYASDIS